MLHSLIIQTWKIIKLLLWSRDCLWNHAIYIPPKLACFCYASSVPIDSSHDLKFSLQPTEPTAFQMKKTNCRAWKPKWQMFSLHVLVDHPTLICNECKYNLFGWMRTFHGETRSHYFRTKNLDSFHLCRHLTMSVLVYQGQTGKWGQTVVLFK